MAAYTKIMQKSSGHSDVEPLVLAVFLTPENRNRAMANLSCALAEVASDSYQVFEFDVTEMPEIAEVARILATPTLIRYWPQPTVRIMGDLAEVELVKRLLFDAPNDDDVFVAHDVRRTLDDEENEANLLRQTELEKREALLDQREAMQFQVLEALGAHARELAEKEKQLGHRERFVSHRESENSTDCEPSTDEATA